jgi:hypothetical protein
MSSKKAFVVGMGVGASGAGLGAMILSGRKRIAGLFRRPNQKGQPVSLASGASYRPSPRPVSGLATSNSSTPKPIPGISRSKSKAQPKPIPGISGSKPKSLPGTSESKPAPAIQLYPASITIRSDDGSTKKADGYQVVRPSGASTGLAITPYQSSADGNESWGVTHMNSGALVQGPFKNISEAQGLAARLSELRWTRLSVPPEDLSRAQQIVSDYEKSLAAGQ